MKEEKGSPYLRDEMSDEGVIQGFHRHALVDVVGHGQNVATAEQLHQVIHQAALQLQLRGRRGRHDLSWITQRRCMSLT